MGKTVQMRFTAGRRSALVLCTVATTGLLAGLPATAGELMVGCLTRPAYGKVCKLVCDTKTLTVTCYGCECDQVCIPDPSQPGCKHCSTNCCNGVCGRGYDCGYNDLGCDVADYCGTCGGGCGDCCQNHAPKCEFCWRDWCACGCATPRTVKKLTKYEAQKQICWYHWVVVDSCYCGCGCGCDDACGGAVGCDCVYKEAPESAQIGDTFELSTDEQAEIAERVKAATDSGALALSSTQAPPHQAALAPDEARLTLPAAEPASETAEPAEASKWQGISSLFRFSGDD